MASRTERMLRLAGKVAELSDSSFRMGAVIAKGSTVISLGHNKRYKTHTKQACNVLSKGTHAEVSAIVRARQDLRGTTIYVARLLHSGAAALAKPCKFCQAIIEEAGIKKVVYTK